MGHIHELYDFTTSAFIMHPTEKKILLLLHNKIGKWLQPGGHIELNEDPLQALTHELEEETGLTPDQYTIIEPADSPKASGGHKLLPLPFYFNTHHFDDTHRHIDICYLAKSKTENLTDFPDGASAIGWVTLRQMQEFLEEDQMFSETFEVCEWIFKNKM